MMDSFKLWSKPGSGNHGRVSKQCSVRISPEKRILSGNFTQIERTCDVTIPVKHHNMRHDIFNHSSKKSDTKVLDQMLDEFGGGEKMALSDNPTYEDPRDVVVGINPVKPPRKRAAQPNVMSPRANESKSLLKEQRRKLTRKYENLIVTLMDRCEENTALLTTKESQLAKLKEKLKAVLDYNRLFAEENDRLKDQYNTMLKYVEDRKLDLKQLETRNEELEDRNQELMERVRRFELPDREESSTTVPLVEVCMSCSSRQILLTRLRDHNSRANRDLQALKELLYRLNVQLANYQERLRNSQTVDKDHVHRPCEALDSLITTSLGYKQDVVTTEENSNRIGRDTPQSQSSEKVVDLSGLLSAQALAPLFDAYQDNIQEKENLILDYEKQFEAINLKSKQIVEHNTTLKERVNSLEEEMLALSKRERKLAVEKETADMEKETLIERAERAENKLKEVYELYEDKMAAMMRDYETVHREYYAAKSALAASEGRRERMDAALRDRTVPAGLHERSVDQCKRLLDELKHQYSMEGKRKAEQIAKLEEDKREMEDKYNAVCKELSSSKEELKTALKNIRLYRRAAVVFRQRLQARARSLRRRRGAGGEQHALRKLDAIKTEIKAVKSRAFTSLEELERRILEQERRAARAESEYRRELDRAQLVLQHKEGIIRSLIDKVADVEEVRLSQTNTQRLQGIVTESSPERSPQERDHKREERRQETTLTPGPGGYYMDKRDRRRIDN